MTATKSPAPDTRACDDATDKYGVPEVIYLQAFGDDEPDELTPVDVTDGVSWCWHPVFPNDVKYIRADLVQGDKP